MGKTGKTKLILGSSSSVRKKVLEDAGFTFDIRTADIDEKTIRSSDFNQMVIDIAQAKLDAILAKNTFDPDTIIITSDFVGSYKGDLREKPISKEQVLSWHKDYMEGDIVCHCSLVAHHVGKSKTLSAVDNAVVTLGEIPERVIEEMANDPFTYKVATFTDRSFFHYMKKMDGSLDTVLGIPVRILESFLEELGYYD